MAYTRGEKLHGWYKTGNRCTIREVKSQVGKECFCRITQLQDESLQGSTQRGVRSAVLHVSAEYYLWITAHGKLQVSPYYACFFSTSKNNR